MYDLEIMQAKLLNKIMLPSKPSYFNLPNTGDEQLTRLFAIVEIYAW
jgi:hypothetical protein